MIATALLAKDMAARFSSMNTPTSRPRAGQDVVGRSYGTDDNPRIIDETRQYISDFDRLDKKTTTAEELYWQIEELYWQIQAIHPHRVNPGALWLSAQSAKA